MQMFSKVNYACVLLYFHTKFTLTSNFMVSLYCLKQKMMHSGLLLTDKLSWEDKLWKIIFWMKEK